MFIVGSKYVSRYVLSFYMWFKCLIFLNCFTKAVRSMQLTEASGGLCTVDNSRFNSDV